MSLPTPRHCTADPKPRASVLIQDQACDTQHHCAESSMLCVQQPATLDLQMELTRELYSLMKTMLCVRAKSLQSRLTLCNPHGLQPARLLCLWDSLGKNTRVGCHAHSGGSSRHRAQTRVSSVSCIGMRVLYHQHYLGSPSENSFIQNFIFLACPVFTSTSPFTLRQFDSDSTYFFFLKKQSMSVDSSSPLCSLSLSSDGRSTVWALQEPLVRRDLHKPRVDPFSL